MTPEEIERRLSELESLVESMRRRCAEFRQEAAHMTADALRAARDSNDWMSVAEASIPAAYTARLRHVIASSRELLAAVENRNQGAAPVVPQDMARRHLAQGERIVAEQKARIAGLRAKGLDTRAAEHVLDGFNRALQLMHDEVADQQ
jgi:hypothetical protein